MKKIVLFIFSLFFMAFLYAQESVKNVIVVTNSENVSSGEKAWLPNSVKDRFEANLQTYTPYSLISTNEAQIKELQRKSESAGFDSKTAIELGKLTSASHAAFLTVRKAGANYTITVEFANLSTGKNIAKCVSNGKTSTDSLTNGAGCVVDLLTIDFCDKVGIKLSGIQRFTLQGIEVSDSDALASYNQEIENYKKQMASFDKEIASLSKSSDLSATAKKAKLESERAMAEQRKKSAEENKARLAEIEKAKREEAANNASRTKEQQEKILAVSKESNAKIAELKKLKVASLSALGKIGVIETKKGAIVDIQNNVLKEQNSEEAKITKEYNEKIASVKNAPYRTFEKNADGTIAPEAIAERNKKIENLKSECNSKIAETKSKIASATYESQAEIVSEIVGDLMELKYTTFYANTLNKNLRVKVGNYNRSSDGWQVFYTVLCDGIALFSGQTDIKYADLEKMMPSNMEKWDAVDMYDSLFKCGEPVLTFGVEYSIGLVESDWSKYKFNISKLIAYDTKVVSVDNKGKLSGNNFGCGSSNIVTKEMKPSYYLSGIANFVISDSERKELVKIKQDQKIAEYFGSSKFVSIPNESYSILSTEVTQKTYKEIMGENPSHFKGDNLPVENVSWYDAIYFCNKLSEKFGFQPVYYVDGKTDVTRWYYTPHKENSIRGSIEYNINANGFRLPKEKEWKYAAEGGENYTYSGSNNLDEVGWYEENSGKKTHPVGKKKANGYGLYDMSGNVWEWCWDRGYNYDYTFSYSRGGCRGSNDDDCKVSNRSADNASFRYSNVGFRLVRSVQ